MSTVKRPTLDQMQEIVASLHMNMSAAEVAEYLDVLEGTFQPTTASTSCRTTCRRCAIPARQATGPVQPRIRSMPGR